MEIECAIKGGMVFDPASGLEGVADVGIHADRIVAIAPQLPTTEGTTTIDATGLLVVPGLIDLHTHIFEGGTYWGIEPDPIAARSGVTTWVDAGSAGALNLAAFRRLVVERARVRVLAYLHISAIGLVGVDYEADQLEHCDGALLCRTARRSPDLVVGVKVRMGVPTIGSNGCEPLRLARRAADELGLPIMVHVADGPPELSAVLSEMRAGDILTHCCTGHSMGLIEDGVRVRAEAHSARNRGILFDVGHGSGSFSFRSAECMMANGFQPDIISSDLHQLSRYGHDLLDEPPDGLTYYVAPGDTDPLDLPACMSKFLHLGMSLAEVIRSTTERPARALGRYPEIGALRVGAVADIAMLRLVEGDFVLFDTHGESRHATRALQSAMTIRAGQVLKVGPEEREEPPDWVRYRKTPSSHDPVGERHTKSASTHTDQD